MFTNRQLWWNKHDPDFKEFLDTYGKNDVESKLGEWTKVECVCDRSKLTVYVNDVKVNHAYDVTPRGRKDSHADRGLRVVLAEVGDSPVEEVEPAVSAKRRRPAQPALLASHQAEQQLLIMRRRQLAVRNNRWRSPPSLPLARSRRLRHLCPTGFLPAILARLDDRSSTVVLRE